MTYFLLFILISYFADHNLMFYFYSGLDSPTLPPVQVFDKTLTVKQLHVLEPQDLIIVRADKGKKYVFIFICA